jgi:hypothetical protein
MLDFSLAPLLPLAYAWKYPSVFRVSSLCRLPFWLYNHYIATYLFAVLSWQRALIPKWVGTFPKTA